MKKGVPNKRGNKTGTEVSTVKTKAPIPAAPPGLAGYSDDYYESVLHLRHTSQNEHK